MSKRDDDALIAKAQAGDRLAFATLLERHYGLMFKVAWKWCGVREDAEDIAQEASMKLARNLHSFMFEAAFTTWLYRLVVNAAKDYYKAKNRRNARELPLYDGAVHVSEELTPEEQMEQKDALKAVAALPETLRETVVLVCWEGLSHREASEVLECSEGTVSWRVHEARKKIAEKMAQEKKAVRHG